MFKLFNINSFYMELQTVIFICIFLNLMFENPYCISDEKLADLSGDESLCARQKRMRSCTHMASAATYRLQPASYPLS